MERRWVCLATLGPIGVAALVYIVVARGFVEGQADHTLAWPMLGVLPMFVFGIWLLTVSASRTAVMVALAATAMLVSSAYETLMLQNPQLAAQPWFPLFNAIGLTADGTATAAFLMVFATFPDGVVEHRWQRIAVAFLWLPLLAAPLTLLTTPHVVMSPYIGISGDAIPNPYAVPWLEWAAAPVYYLVVQSWVAVAIGLTVLGTRALFGAPEVRARTRVMALVVAGAMVAFLLWTFFDNWLVQVLVYASLIAIPIAAIHGILSYGAFDIAPGDRGRLVARSSNLLITVIYAAAVATPALLLAPPLRAVPAILITTLFAVALLPVRTWLQRRLHRRLFGDRERQLEMLGELGARLEQAVEPRELLTRLAEAVREGLDASWVRIGLVSADGRLAPMPGGIGVAGTSTTTSASAGAGAAGEVAVDVCDLVHGDEVLGRIEVGPRRRGEYSEAERMLLRTVAGQAAASVANARLTVQLAEQLEELTASRERLIAVQDDERRRLERDLHDGIQQDVVAQIAGLRLARNRLQRGELTSAELEELQEQARATLTDLRELARGIHPPVLSDNGLAAAVESGVARFPIPLTVEADERVRGERFSDDVETTAYYVVREALANTAKHANATHASVGLARDDGRLRIAIADDGCGIDAEHAVGAAAARASGRGANGVPVSHGGLANIRDRVAALRGTMRVTANEPSGTIVTVELPVDGVAAGGSASDGVRVG
ncbi:sensor histidine kinase [Agromyces sp. NPDC058136]|uniref:sensor histidine kinase n=1 Tax=Agromyces sp. NPDC058136 TaxID=3346354 RepID=UPI0036DD1FDC